MSKLTIEWTIKAHGREAGDRETVESTSFIDALIAQRRVFVVEVHEEPKPAAPLDAPKPEPVPTAEEVMAKGLTERPKPGGRRRAPAKEL